MDIRIDGNNPLKKIEVTIPFLLQGIFLNAEIKGQVSTILNRGFLEAFKSKQDSSGSSWQALSPEYAKRKFGKKWGSPLKKKRSSKAQAKFGKVASGGDILVLTGKLRTAVITNLDATVDGRTVTVEGNSFEVTIGGRSLPYAARQNYGGGGIPAREYLYIKKNKQSLIEKAIAKYIIKTIQGGSK